MLRIITELKPYWIIGENVAGLVSMAQRQGIPVVESETDNAEEDNDNPGADGILCEIIESIESIGYDVQAFIIPAVAVGAPHRRDRIWVVAHTRHRDGQRPEDYGKLKRQIFNKKNAVKPERPNSDGRKELIGDTPGIRWDKRVGDREGRHVQNTPIGKIAEDKQERNRWECGTCAGDSDAPDTSDKGLEGCGGKRKRFLGLKDRTRCDERREWGKNWLEVATELCRMDDGLPVELDGFKLTKAGHRVERLKALGNAIVPQVVFEIMNAIKNIELDKNGFKM
jgi:DNA (cytosine-5)-methyltransferase 1